ncbi:Mrp family chromosome partitioning ATPase [Lachnospiraceae bacterium PM6-15]|uniref:P-loop NTPase n=1 Tax=Ohessyouella blattaphilus TaxID=2949333 RepID=UPI003E2D9015
MSTEQECQPSDCEGCASAGNCGKEQQMKGPEKLVTGPSTEIKHAIAIVSGKGGVGKSMVTALMAKRMKTLGKKVGIMDADITGPSIPKMYGIHKKAMANEEGMIPEVTSDGTKIMSINLLLENQEDPVIWRSPIITGVVQQFYKDVVWGDLDYLFIDMPPGTGDVPLTVFQTVPIDGIIIVTSPQDLVRSVVEKSINMAEVMNVPVLGLVENYSYLKCPDCGKEIAVFGESKIEELAEKHKIPILAKVPIDANIAELVEEERFAEVSVPYLDGVEKLI